MSVDAIQYAVVVTNAINMVMTIVAVCHFSATVDLCILLMFKKYVTELRCQCFTVTYLFTCLHCLDRHQ